jgi:hypothetical protein
MTSKFLLVHSPTGVDEARTRVAAARKPPAASLKQLGTRLRRRANSFAGGLFGPLDSMTGGLVNSASPMPPLSLPEIAEPSAGPSPAPRVTIGVWSLNAWLGSVLGEIVDAFNAKQSTFVFFEIDSLVPAGLISKPERMVPWLRKVTGREPDERTQREIRDNLIANEYFDLAKDVRTDLGLDYIVGITPSMVAGLEDDGGVYYNYFSTFEGEAVLASTNQLHEYAEKSGWPFEAFLANIIMSQFLVAMFWPKLGYHPDRGCLFDQNRRRAAIIDKVVDPEIEADCMEQIDLPFRAATKALLDQLGSYGKTKR